MLSFIPTPTKDPTLVSQIAKESIFQITGKLPKKDENWIPIFEDSHFWSISHKENLIFLGIDSVPLGVDLEIIKPRGTDAFSLHTDPEYQLIGGKNWENFYRLRTLKESIIKLYLSNLEELQHITLTHLVRQDCKREGIPFDTQIQGSFLEKQYICFTWKDREKVYSIAYNI